jgi:aryl-alcohol dehydrogenase-like predicted oxidoreductase
MLAAMTGPRSGSGRLVVGTAQLGQPYGVANRTGQPSPDDAVAIIRRAAAAGVAALDTAPAYGTAESLIRAAEVDVPVFTKVPPGASPRSAVERSLERLGRDRVDVLFFHDPAVVLHDGNAVDEAASLVGTLVGKVGVSVYTPAELAAALDDPRLQAIEAPVSVADQRLPRAGLLRAAAAKGVEVYARSVLLQGALLLADGALPAHLAALAPVNAAVRDVAAAEGRTAAEVLVAFVRDLDGVTAVVVGAETAAQLDEALASISSPRLSPPSLAALGAVVELPAAVVDPREWP